MAEDWNEFLKNATANEVFHRIGKTITFNEKLSREQINEMSERIWKKWKELNGKQTPKEEEWLSPDWWSK